MRHGLTADVLRRYFKYVVVVAAIPAGIIGWIAGPILAEVFQ